MAMIALFWVADRISGSANMSCHGFSVGWKWTHGIHKFP
jgi:hypothetical protein